MRDTLRILITAGPTREYIDPVRFISNESSGKMGFAIAAAAAERGHRVTLIHGPVALEPPANIRAVAVISAHEMLAACEKQWPRHDVLIMAAAVADYRPAQTHASKLKKKTSMLTLKLEPTVDILTTLSHCRKMRQITIGFALEDRDVRRRAEDKLRRKNLDAIVLNRPAAIGSDRSVIEVLTRDGVWSPPARRAKAGHALRIVALAESLARRGSHGRDAPPKR